MCVCETLRVVVFLCKASRDIFFFFAVVTPKCCVRDETLQESCVTRKEK